MNDMQRFETVNDYNVFNNNETLHPLVSVVDLSKASPRKLSSMYFGFYTVFLKEVKCGDLRYGKNTYDYQEGTLVFIGPGQVVTVENTGEMYQPKGHALLFMAPTWVGILMSILFLAINQTRHCMFLKGKEKWCWIVFQK